MENLQKLLKEKTAAQKALDDHKKTDNLTAEGQIEYDIAHQKLWRASITADMAYKEAIEAKAAETND